MKTRLSKISLTTFLLLALGASANSQQLQTSILVDELESSGCEDLAGRLDAFLNDLRNNPTSVGYAVISANPDVAPRLGWTERFIDGYSRHRGFEESRLIVVRGDLTAPVQIQLWRVPLGAELPVQSASETRYKMGSARKFRLYSDFDEFGPCYTGPPLRILSKYLKADRGLSANIAIGSPSPRSFRVAKKQVIESFENDYKTDPSRLRFFWVRTTYEPAIYELWLIRQKRK